MCVQCLVKTIEHIVKVLVQHLRELGGLVYPAPTKHYIIVKLYGVFVMYMVKKVLAGLVKVGYSVGGQYNPVEVCKGELVRPAVLRTLLVLSI